MKTTTLILSVALLGSACAVSAQNIVSLSFGNAVAANQNVNNATYTGPTSTGSAGISAGLVDAGFWTDVSVRGAGTNYASGNTLSNLTADDGLVSAIDATFTFPSTYGANITQGPASTANQRIYRDGLAGNTSTAFSISLSDMSAFLSANSETSYDVYIYSLVNNALGEGVYSFTDGSSTFYQAAEDSDITPWFNGSFTQVTSTEATGSIGNYIKFSGLTSDTLSITGTYESGAGNPNLRIGGVQVVAVPEPSTYAFMAGFLALGLVIYRRRKLS